jgi:uncharacterized protein (TIGR03000 family)
MGCYGGRGGCYGGYATGGYGGGYAGYAMPYGSYAGMPAYGGYTSGYYMPGTPAGTLPAPTDQGIPGGGTAAPADQGGRRGTSDEDRSKESLAPAPATIQVTLPSDAKLMIDDYTTRSTSSTRTFVTPPLTPGRDFHYTLKAELQRGTEPVKVSREVTVRAGQETPVTIEFPVTGVARK